MALSQADLKSSRGLDFFIQTEMACRNTLELVRSRAGESALRTMLEVIARDLALAHDLPLQRLNDCLKGQSSVDPTPLDTHLAQIFDSMREWLAWVTKSDWLVEVMHHIAGRIAHHTDFLDASERVGGAVGAMDLELETIGSFMYPVPLKIRDLQAMLRPFMETRSKHHIVGLDAIVSEVMRAILRVFQDVQLWDDILMTRVTAIAEAEQTGDTQGKRAAVLELCSICDTDAFEASHRLWRIDPAVFGWSFSDTENVCQHLPSSLDQQLVRGPPLNALDLGATAAAAQVDSSAATAWSSATADEDAPATQAEVNRQECLSWWHAQNFEFAVGTRIFASALLTHLVDAKLHPDPWVAEMTPRVLERLFGPQISCRLFMNRFLHLTGGYVDSFGREVPRGEGFPLLSSPARCAESLLAFLRQWSDLVLAYDEEEAARKMRLEEHKQETRRRRSVFTVEMFTSAMLEGGHTKYDIADLLDGIKPLPPQPSGAELGGKRYRVTDEMVRMWELVAQTHLDVTDTLQEDERDLGPYIHLDIEDPEEVLRLVGRIPAGSWSVVHPDIVAAAKKGRQPLEDAGDQEELPTPLRVRKPDASESLMLRLTDWPPELGPEAGGSSSTFLRFFAQESRRISRAFLQGLPALPWSFGSDGRNTIVIDLAGSEGIAPFHCLFTQARAQPHRFAVMALGDPTSPTHIICPKYQPLPVRNGDRLVCNQWMFELRLDKDESGKDALSILTDEGGVFQVPFDGCHVGAGSRSRLSENEPFFPSAKFSLAHRLKGIAAVHVVFQYQACTNRWCLIDHSHEPLGCLLQLKPGVAYPLSEGSRLKVGPLILQVGREALGG